MSEIIDLYSKFLLAFVGIVTPALSIFLNNYLIDRTRFEGVVKGQKEFSEDLIKKQFEIVKNSKDTNGLDFMNTSNELLRKTNEKLRGWEDIVERLNPKKFFVRNLWLLGGALFFLFIMLFIRTCKIVAYDNSYFQPFQISTFLISVTLCSIHVFLLIRLGLYLILVRPIVDEINLYIKTEKLETINSAIEVVKDLS